MKRYGVGCTRIKPGALCFLTVLVFVGELVGCGGNNNPQTVTIELAPTSIDFDNSNNLYFVENPSSSVWMFTNPDNESINSQILLAPGSQGGFSPWGLSTDARLVHDVLFITDATTGAQRLMAVDISSGSVNSSTSIILASVDTFDSSSAGGRPEDHFSGLRGVTAYTIEPEGAILRVFVADQNRVVVFDYDTSAKNPTFPFKTIITSPAGGNCPDSFQEPWGVAVDRDNHYLYVVDRGGERLFQFSGVNAASPSCDGEVEDGNGERLDKPQGVSVMAGQDPKPNQVLVADSGNDRIISFVWNGTNLIASEQANSLDNPFDLAFDKDMSLWITYPDVKTFGIEEKWPPDSL